MKANGEGAAEDEMVGWHHRDNGRELEPTPVEDREVWNAAVHGGTESQTRLTD